MLQLQPNPCSLYRDLGSLGFSDAWFNFSVGHVALVRTQNYSCHPVQVSSMVRQQLTAKTVPKPTWTNDPEALYVCILMPHNLKPITISLDVKCSDTENEHPVSCRQDTQYVLWHPRQSASINTWVKQVVLSVEGIFLLAGKFSPKVVKNSDTGSTKPASKLLEFF